MLYLVTSDDHVDNGLGSGRWSDYKILVSDGIFGTY